MFKTYNEVVKLKKFVDAFFDKVMANINITTAYVFTLPGTRIGWKTNYRSIVVERLSNRD